MNTLIFTVAFLIAIKRTFTYQSPHIVFIYADDLGWNDVGWHNPSVPTHNLNRLAAQGIILDSVYTQPTCTPSRNAFMTGFYPFHTELQKAIENPEALYLPEHYKLLPQYLKDLNYSTHLVGKWHLGFCNEKYTPTRRGFDSFYGILSGSSNHYTHVKANEVPISLKTNISWNIWDAYLMKSILNMRISQKIYGVDFRFNDSVWTKAQGIYSTHAYTTRAIDIIQRHDPETPLFLYIPYQAPHSPIEVPKKYSQRFSHIKSAIRRTYLGMVSAIDESVGNITSALYAKGLMDNLLLVFTSDNGGHPNLGGNNWPLRGGKSSMWEGGTRVPTFVFSETLLQRKKIITNQLMHVVDWLPTLLELAGRKQVYNIDGRSQWRMISLGHRSPRQEVIYDIEPSGKGAIRVGDYKLLLGKPGYHNDWYPPPGDKHVAPNLYKGGKNDKVKVGHEPFLLYNVKDDPAETTDLSKQLPKVAEALLERLQHHNSTRKMPLSRDSTPASNPDNYGGFWSPGWC